ncbi:MAG: ATP-binding protein [Sandaracinaceae bacterium]|nr:ATP-binding protein [Sandaracinaceae bacterium]
MAMDAFRKEYVKDFRSSRPRSIPARDERQWLQSLAEWLYSTDHVRVEYGIRYDGTAIEQLSPGTRGIVLLLLYLAIDQHDRRPIIIDQPEENLDPKSVFEELVPHFRAARKRRQVIIVTHNANLVVNTDADQVIVASSVASSVDALPTISYDAGGLENPRIRKSVCETLEGGERAFLERERRYRLRWDEAVVASDALSGVDDGRLRSNDHRRVGGTVCFCVGRITRTVARHRADPPARRPVHVAGAPTCLISLIDLSSYESSGEKSNVRSA